MQAWSVAARVKGRGALPGVLGTLADRGVTLGRRRRSASVSVPVHEVIASAASLPRHGAKHALISLLAVNSCASADADTEAMAVQRGHRTLTIVRKGGKKVPVPRSRL